MPLWNNKPVKAGYKVHQQSLLFGVASEDYFLGFTQLPGYTFGELTPNTGAKIEAPVVTVRGGRLYTLMETIRPEFVKNYTVEISFLKGEWMRGPLSPLVKNLSNCVRDFLLVNTCPTESCLEFYMYFPNGRMGAIKPGQLITVEDDAVVTDATADLEVVEPNIGFHLRQTLTNTVAPDSLYSVAFCEPNCDDCTDVCQNLIAGDTVNLYQTSDGFATTSVVAASLPVGSIITSLICLGDKVIGTYADTADPTTGLTGGTFYSNDGGTTTVAVPLAVAMYDVSEVVNNGYAYVAVGNGGAIFGSVDGATWTAIVNPLYPAGIWYSIAYDKSSTLVYIAGQDGGAVSTAITMDGGVFADITANVAPTGVLSEVEVLAPNHVMFGDLIGNIYENPETNVTASYTTVASPTVGLATPIQAIAGDRSRVVIGSGAALYERSPLTNREFTVSTTLGTVFSGDVTDGKMCESGNEIFPGPNHFVFVTDTGEIVTLKPCPPDYS